MEYKKFTLLDLRNQFKIENKIVDLFNEETIQPIPPSDFLLQQLREAQEIPVKSEKARSELIITPILMELRRNNRKFFTIYSGDHLVADKEKGLTGECDFIIAQETGSFSINVPLLAIVEAKRQNIELGINQCAAQLYGAHIFNQKSGKELPKIYGCVTTADNWQFLLLENNVVKIDNQIYYKSELSKILGIFQEVIDYYRGYLSS